MKPNIIFTVAISALFLSVLAHGQDFRISGESALGYRDTVIFGIVPTATFCVDAGLGEVNSSGPPPAPWGSYFTWMNPRTSALCDADGCFDCGRIRTSNGPARDYRPYLGPAQSDTFRIFVQPNDAGGGYPFTLGWQDDFGSVFDSIRMKYSGSAGTVAVDMALSGSHTVTDPTVSTLWIITWGFGVNDPPPPPHLTYPVGYPDRPLILDLQWDAAPGAEYYRVEYSSDPFFTDAVHEDTTSSTSVSVGPLTPATTYYWRVQSVNSAGAGSWSDVPWFSTLVPVLAGSGTATVDGVMSELEYSGADTLTLTVNLPGGGTGPGTIYQMTDGENLYFGIRIPGVGTPYSVSAGFEFFRNLSSTEAGDDAINANVGTWSPLIFNDNFTSDAPPCPPGVICSFPDTGDGGRVDGAVAFLEGGGVFTIEMSHPLRSGDTLHDFNLSPGSAQGFRFSVRIFEGAPYADSYESSSFRVTMPVPVLLHPPDKAAGQQPSPTLSWNNIFGAAQYHLQVATDSLFAGIIHNDSTLTDTSAVVGPLQYSTAYYWRVRGRNQMLEGKFSPVRVFSTIVEAPGVAQLLFPADDTTDVDLPFDFNWSPAERATSYRIQVSTDSSFTSPVADDSLFTETHRVLPGLSHDEHYYWRVRGGNAGETGPWSPVWEFTTGSSPLAGTVLLYPPDGSSDHSVSPVCSWQSDPAVTGYHLQIAMDASFAVVVFEDAMDAETTSVCDHLTYGGRFFWRVRGLRDLVPGPWSDVWQFTTAPLAVDVSGRWNLVSLPVVGVSADPSDLFPPAVTPAYTFTRNPHGYEVADTLVPGIGYWMKFPGAGSFGLAGDGVDAWSVEVDSGWNLVGSSCRPVGISGITSDPPGLATSAFYGYESTYFTVDTIRAGKGYWVFAVQPGRLISDGSAPMNAAKSASHIRTVLDASTPPPPPSEVAGGARGVPQKYALLQNYPNPFNPVTSIAYALPVDSHVRLTVFDLTGREVAILVDGTEGAGIKTVEWDARGIASGVYVYRMTSVGVHDPGRVFVESRKMVVLK